MVAPKPEAAPRPKPAGDAVAGAVQGLLAGEPEAGARHAGRGAPEGQEWLSEVKFDGYRLLVRKHGRDVRLITRNGLDWSAKLPDIARAVARLKPDRLLLDGELVALRPDGLSSFAALQAALSEGGDRRGLFLYLFDLLHLDGWDLRDCRLADRKAALQPLDGWAWRAAVQRPPGRRDAARPPPGLRDGAGGHHLQACRRALPRGPDPRLGEGEMPGAGRVHHPRLDPAGRQSSGSRFAAPRLPR